MDIQVVLTENDPKLGKRGQVIKVSPGYAQNFLFPRQKARPATPANLKVFELERARVSKEEAGHLSVAKEQALRISSLRLRLEVSTGEADKLFGSVTNQDIAQALSQQGVSLDRKKILLEEPIKKLGSYQIPIKLHPDLSAALRLELVKKP